MKIVLSAAATLAALSVVVGCGGDEDGDATATDPSSETSTSAPAAEPTVGTYPEFEPDDYTYVLEQICFCPLTGPVEVTVEDGEVTSAVITKGGRGIAKGRDAPDYLRITIDDVIARANDTDAASVEVSWPDGQEWPDRVSVDKVEMATDDEITYLVRDVQVS